MPDSTVSNNLFPTIYDVVVQSGLCRKLGNPEGRFSNDAAHPTNGCRLMVVLTNIKLNHFSHAARTRD